MRCNNYLDDNLAEKRRNTQGRTKKKKKNESRIRKQAGVLFWPN